MKWHIAEKEMPSSGVPVLLAWLNRDNKYDKNCVATVTSNFDGSDWIESTITGGGRTFSMDIGDRWAYIDLPE